MDKSASDPYLSAYRLETGRRIPCAGLFEVDGAEPCADRFEREPFLPAAAYDDETSLSVYRRWRRWVSIVDR